MFDISGYSKFSIHRIQYGGGITVFYNDELTVEKVDNLSYVTAPVEILSFRIKSSVGGIFMSCLYRPPMTSISDFNELFSQNIFQNIPNNEDVLICGDFNVNIFNPLRLPCTYDFIQIFAGRGYFPVVEKPTQICLDNRVTKFSSLDQIWINFSNGCNLLSGVIDCDISDHRPSYFICKRNSS